jgi:hypothetical protein
MTSTTTTTTTWKDSHGETLLTFTREDSEPYWIPSQFFTDAKLRELYEAIGEALGEQSK